MSADAAPPVATAAAASPSSPAASPSRPQPPPATSPLLSYEYRLELVQGTDAAVPFEHWDTTDYFLVAVELPGIADLNNVELNCSKTLNGHLIDLKSEKRSAFAFRRKLEHPLRVEDPATPAPADDASPSEDQPSEQAAAAVAAAPEPSPKAAATPTPGGPSHEWVDPPQAVGTAVAGPATYATTRLQGPLRWRAHVTGVFEGSPTMCLEHGVLKLRFTKRRRAVDVPKVADF